MNHNAQSSQSTSQSRAYRHAFARLGAALAEKSPVDNHETIALMRRACFADVDELERSGEVILPKYVHDSK